MMTGTELNQWRFRMGYTIAQAATALGLTKGRLIDNLYLAARPPSRATAALARLIEAEKAAAHNPRSAA